MIDRYLLLYRSRIEIILRDTFSSKVKTVHIITEAAQHLEMNNLEKINTVLVRLIQVRKRAQFRWHH